MRRFASAIIASTAVTMAFAAPALARSPFDGAYIGGFVGYTDGDVETTVGALADDVGVDGFDGGLYAGYGQTFDRLYVGAEAEIGYGEIDGDGTVGTLVTAFETDWTYGVAARAGFLATDNVLVYGRVGYQWTEFQGVAISGGTAVGLDRTFDGWRVGGGVEVAVTDNLLTRLEYNYTNYDQFGFDATIGGTVESFEPDSHSFRVGLAYKF